jgi:hypothetical protein
VALVLAVGMGSAYAAGKIGPKDIAPDAVRTKHIKDGHVRASDLAPDSVSGGHILDNTILRDHLTPNSVGSSALVGLSVGSSELMDPQTANSAGTEISAGNAGNAQVTCPPGTKVIGGGFAWQDDEPASIISSAPSETHPSATWIVRGFVPAGSNTLYAWANCLAS